MSATKSLGLDIYRTDESGKSRSRLRRSCIHSRSGGGRQPTPTRLAWAKTKHQIPKFRDAHDRRFYREVVQTYRTAARDILKAWSDDRGQDIAEYAVMLAVILVIVVGTIRLIGSNANTVFSQAASTIQ